MPSAVIGNLSPFEVLYGIKPHYAHLKTFGCLCYASTLKRQRDKLQPRAKPCVFLGYPYGQKAYKLLDLDSKHIFTSRDVRFHEHIFPFHHFQHQSTVPLPVVTTFIPDVQDFQQPALQTSTDTAPSLLTTTTSPHSSPDHSTTTYPAPAPSVSIPTISPSLPPLRRTSRQPSKPKYLQDYFCGLVASTDLPIEHHSFVSLLTQYSEPKSYE